MPMAVEQPTTPRDQGRIHIDDPSDVAYWCQRFGVTAEQLKAAVRNVGPAVPRVERELRRR